MYTSTECAIEIGKLLNARKIIIGTVSKLGTNYFITGRIVDIETGKVEVSERAKCAGLEELEIGSKLIAYKFAGIQPDEKVLKGDAKLVMQQEEQPKVAPVTPTYQPYVESPSTPQPYMESSSGSMSWLNWTGIIAGSTLGILGLVTASTADEKASGYYTDYLAATSVSDAEYYHGRVEYYDKQVATDKTIAAVGFATAGLFIIIEILSSGDSTTNRASNVSENFRVSIAPEKSGLRITNEWTF